MLIRSASLLRLSSLLLFLQVIIPPRLFAQSTGSVSGRVVNGNSPVEFATVIFYQSSHDKGFQGNDNRLDRMVFNEEFTGKRVYCENTDARLSDCKENIQH